MNSLKTRAKFIIANALQTEHSDGSVLSYNGNEIEVMPYYVDSNKIDEQPTFDLTVKNPILHIFALLDDEDWKFFLLRTSVIKSTFDGDSSVSLNLLKPMAIQTSVGSLKSAVDLVISA